MGVDQLAEDFREEHQNAMKWLNKHLEKEIGFFACRIEAWQIGASEKAPSFEVIVAPEQIEHPPTTPARRQDPEGIDVNRVAYWGAFSEELMKSGLPLKIRSEPPRMGFCTFTISAPHGVYLYVYREVATKKIGAYVSCATVPPPIPRLVFEFLEAERTQIETEYGGDLDWRCVKPDKNYRVMVAPIDGDPLDESDWPRQHGWLVEQLAKLLRVFEPRVRKLPPRDQLLSNDSTA